MSPPPSSSSGSPGRKTPMSIKRSYSARVQRRVRTGYRHEGDATSGGARRQRGRFGTMGRPRGSGAAFGLAVDRAAGSGPAGEADREMGDVREPHLAEHVRGERGALPAGAVHDDALGRIAPAGGAM